jgi:EmrB/QacA subfamily drug resistance transporter
VASPVVELQAPEEVTTAADPRRWWVLAVLCLALAVVGIDGTIVNVALPTMVRELGATASQLQWIVDAYTIVFAGFLLIAGNTGDRLGRKPVLIIGLIIFGVGSMLCSQATTPEQVIAMRAVQGFGAAFIMPSTLSILTNVFADADERRKAISIWAGVSGLGVAVGPLAGGWLIEHFWWGSIFLVNVPLIVVAVAATVAIVPNTKDADAPALDLVGTVLSTSGLILLLFGVIEGPGKGWSDPTIVASFTAAAVLLVSFVFWERHSDHPLLDVRIFANPRFSAASVAVTLVFFAMFGALFFVSQYLQFVLGYSALESGVRLLPLAASLMVAAPLSAKLVGAFGTKLIVAAGLATVAASLVVLSFADVDSGYPPVALTLVLVGAGMGLAMAPATDSIMGSLPPERAGVGSAVNDTTREIGGALGVAILGSITSGAYAASITGTSAYATVAQASPEAAKAMADSIGGAAAIAAQAPAQVSAAITAAANTAFIDALGRTTIVAAVVALAGAVVALIWLPARADLADLELDLDLRGDLGRTELVLDAARSMPVVAGAGRATLQLLADAGMSSLSFAAISARSGVPTATLERHWTSKVDAVEGALVELFGRREIPDTGNLRGDLDAYLSAQGALLAHPGARAVIGTLIKESASDPALGEELRARLVQPRLDRLAARFEAAKASGDVPPDTNVTAAAELVEGGLFYRTLVWGEPYTLDRVVEVLGSGRTEASQSEA